MPLDEAQSVTLLNFPKMEDSLGPLHPSRGQKNMCCQFMLLSFWKSRSSQVTSPPASIVLYPPSTYTLLPLL